MYVSSAFLLGQAALIGADLNRVREKEREAAKRASINGAFVSQFWHDALEGLNQRRSEKSVKRGGKCPCCGSREYVAHAGAEICAYCRVPSGDSPTAQPNDSELSRRFQASKDAYILSALGYNPGQ